MVVRRVDPEALIAAFVARDAAKVEHFGAAWGVALTLEAMAALEELALWQLTLTDVLTAVMEAATSPLRIGLVEWRERTSRQRGRDFVLAVRTEDVVVVGSAHAENSPTKIGGVWPELSPWYRDFARNYERAASWARTVDLERVVLALSRGGSGAGVDEREAALIENVCRAPEDDERRLVYADWLIERGDARGELIQLQCELAVEGRRHPRYDAVVRHEAELIEQHGSRVAGDVARFSDDYRLRRGFVDEVSMKVAVFGEHGEALLTAHPICTLRTRPRSSREVARLARTPPLARVAVLALGSFYDRPIDYAALARSSYIEALQGLSLAGATSTSDAWCDTLSTLSAPHLRSLDLLGATIDAAGLLGLAKNDTCALERLEIGRVRASGSSAAGRAQADAFFRALGHASAFRALRCVGVDGAYGGVTAAQLSAWLSGPNAAHLEQLDLSGSELSIALQEEGALARLTRLRHLHLDGTPLSVEGLRRLLDAIPSLEDLALMDLAGLGVRELSAILEAVPSSHRLRRIITDGANTRIASDRLGRFEVAQRIGGSWWLDPWAWHPSLQPTK